MFSSFTLLHASPEDGARAWPPAQGCGDDRNVSAAAAAAAKPRVGNVTCRVRARGEQRGVEGGATKISNGEKRMTKVFRGFFFFFYYYSYTFPFRNRRESSSTHARVGGDDIYYYYYNLQFDPLRRRRCVNKKRVHGDGGVNDDDVNCILT